MDERQLVCYIRGVALARFGKCLLRPINFFSLLNVFSKSPTYHQN